MSKTDQELRVEFYGDTDSRSYDIDELYLMQVARQDERERIREIVEKRIKQLEALNRIDGDRDEQLEECNYLLIHLKEVSNQ